MKKTKLPITKFTRAELDEALAALPPQEVVIPAAQVSKISNNAEDPEVWYQRLNGRQLELAYDLPIGILKYIIEIESKGNPTAVSSRGAKGLFQLMPPHISGFTGNPFNPFEAVGHVAKQLSKDIKELGSVTLGLAAYNWGRKHVINKGIDKAPPETLNFLDFFRAKGIIPKDSIFSNTDGW